MPRSTLFSVLLPLVLVACSADVPTVNQKVQLQDESRLAGALASVPTCSPSVAMPRFIIEFKGLVDLASEDPGAGTGTVSQDELPVLLINATSDPVVLPVWHSGSIVPHKPLLRFPAVLRNPNGTGETEQDLTDHDVRVVGPPEHEVVMHREPIGTEPTSANTCSLNWTILIDEVAPNSALEPANVFMLVPANVVTSQFVVENGEAYTTSVFRKTGSADPCRVYFSDVNLDRAVARSFAVAVPAVDRKLTMKVEGPNGSDTWTFELPQGMDEAVLTVENRATKDIGTYDFAGHLALRKGMNNSKAVIPIPEYTACEGNLGPGANPQCSPADNDWP